MTLSLSVIAAVFGIVFVLELPDKTMVATLVLSSRYRPMPVVLGVAAAFAIQMSLAVAVGGALTLLPKALTLGIVAAMFAVGAVLMVKESLETDDDKPRDTAATTSFWSIAAIAFGVLFLAEFGDGSQLAAAALSARYEAPLSVFIGAWLAELSVCTIAAFAGQALLRFIPIVWVHRTAALIFTLFATLALFELIQAL